MIGALVQVLLLVGMTHGLRVVGRRLGPRREGLLMGVPSTSALMLVGCGFESGPGEATVAAEACLVGLVASAALPLAYARGASAGWRAPASAGGAVAAYGAVAAALWWVPGLGPVACSVVASAGLAVVCRLAGGIGTFAPGRWDLAGGPPPVSRRRALAYRTAVPAGSFLIVRLLRAVGGAGCSGRFVTFPGASLAVLVTTHLEAGPVAAGRLASAMPLGGVGTLAFLTAFRFGCPRLGLVAATAAGFAAALGALSAVGSTFGRVVTCPRGDLPRVPGRSIRTDPAGRRPDLPARIADLGRGFSPRFEVLA